MALITPQQLTDNTVHTAADHNNPINTIANEFNGNIDNANIKAAAGIATSKLASDAGIVTGMLAAGAVTSPKLSLTGSQTATVAINETLTSTTFVDLTTVGPSVTVTINATGLALVIITTQASNTTSANNILASPVLSGATTTTAAANEVIGGWNFQTGAANQATEFSHTRLYTGLAAGSTTFKLQYRVTGGTGSFARRFITVIPL